MSEKQRENKMRQSNLLGYINRLSLKPNLQKSDESNERQPIKVQAFKNELLNESGEKPLGRLKRLEQEDDDSGENKNICVEAKKMPVKPIVNSYSEKKQQTYHPQPAAKTSSKPSARKSKAKGQKMETDSNNQDSDQPDAPPVLIQNTTSSEIMIQFTDKTPVWALRGANECLDKQKRNCKHPEYDPTTLFIPPNQFKSFSNTMKQFWSIKSDNFDKIILFKLGKFYELFYEDAEVSNKYLNLKWMGTKMHTGFPEKCLDRYLDELVELGFKVVVVQQMETPAEMQERVKGEKKNSVKADRVISREITQVLTKGTYNRPPVAAVAEDGGPPNKSQGGYTPIYLISVQSCHPAYAFSLLDTANNRILIGVSKNLEEFKTMLYRTRPVELLYDPANLSFEDKKLMTQSFLAMIQSPLQNRGNVWHHLNSITLLKESSQCSLLEKEMQQYSQKIQQMIFSCLSGIFEYLKSLLLIDTVLSTAKIEMYDSQKISGSNMILDSQALQHLQLLETSTGQEKGSFLSLINRCKTGFGKRLMKKWLCSPSTNITVINQRLDAVQDLNAYPIDRNRFTEGISKLSDLQIIINRLYRYSVKSLANKAVYFSDVSKQRMKEYKKLFKDMQSSWDLLSVLRRNISGYKSKRLINLLSVTREAGMDSVYMEEETEHNNVEAPLLPDILSHLKQIDSFVKWQDDKPVPQKGLFEAYDQAVIEIAEIEQQLEHYLERERKRLNDPKVQFAHAKERYEIEVPDRTIKKKPQHYIFSSKRQGVERYVTKESRQIVLNLEAAQQKLKDHLRHYTTFFFEEFRKKGRIWENYIRVLAEIDCLVSNATVSQMFESCRPTFNTSGKLNIVQGKHPCLSHLIFVPNNIHLDHERSMMLLTGPNMGGKSTLLRMVCVLAVMAQMGIFVPCQSYDSIIYDRVFTRIGASDRLIENKSTFYIEMEETKSILDSASAKSLVIIDELGRGTSTFDGMSIAEATFKHLCEKIKCMGLFATHYNILVEDFLFDSKVSVYHMSYIVNEGTKDIRFMYKLKQGKCDESFAVNVARMVNINSHIISKAEELARVMKAEIKRKRFAQVGGFYGELLQEFQL